MKGRKRVLFSVLICLTVATLASICLFAGLGRKSDIVKAFGRADEQYSLYDEGNTNAIFSVEKVAVQAGKKEDGSLLTETKDFTTPLYTGYADGAPTGELPKMFSRNYSDGSTVSSPSAVYYQNIGTDTSTKTVVYDGQFVMLNNSWNSDGFYYSETSGSSYDAEGNSVRMQEAILVSFGNYFKYFKDGGLADGKAGQNGYTNANGVAIPAENAGANIEWVRVSAIKNSSANLDPAQNETLELPSSRTYYNENGTRREDFVWVIPQTEDCEGYYEITVNFKYNGNLQGFSFGFYIILGSSYYQSLTDGNGNSYNAYPTMKNAGGESGVQHFYLGENDLNGNYPTISYDVTKYEMDYVHTLNGVRTTYALSNSVGNSNVMNLNVTKTTGTRSYTYSYPLGRVGGKGNIAVVVFTEIGNYSINFRYKYHNKTMPNMNLSVDTIELTIHGFELKYAKAGRTEAQMRHLTFDFSADASTSEMGIGLVVSNGYMSEADNRETALGLIYDYNTASTNSVGNIEKREWANVGVELSGDDGNEVDTNQYFGDDGNFNIEFAKTNQGSLWFDSVDSFVSKKGDEAGSFYYFAPTINALKTAIQNDEQIAYSTTTSFNQTGYYLVFLKVDAKNVNKQYYSVFAFQYTADTVSVHTEKINGDDSTVPIGSGAYTNQNVKVWWELPGVFEREINVKFIKSENITNADRQQYPTWQQLATRIDAEGTDIQSGDELGGELGSVDANSGALFLIKLQMTGKSATYRTFYIDRQPINGVQAYAVESNLNRLNNVIYTTIKDINGNNLAISNAITDSFATLTWADKKSGAKITATYTKTPIMASNSVRVGEVGSWITTNYTLGATIGEMELKKADLNGELTSANVVFDSAIYLFTLTDEAGNSCKYLFVVDKTENFFKITQGEDEQFVTRDNLLFTSEVTISVADAKAIMLQKTNGNAFNSELFKLIDATETGSTDNLTNKEINYYSQAGTNLGALFGLFGQNGGNYYLTVKNGMLNVYNNQRELLSANGRSYIVKALGSSNIAQAYVVGDNQIGLTNALNSRSYVIVEVNTDHALGMAFYGSSQQTLTNFDNISSNVGKNGATRLNYDNDFDEATGTGKRNLDAAHATGADYLAFTWKMGEGTDYEVNSVVLKYYQLNLTKTGAENFLEKYFYSSTPNLTQTLYKKGAAIPTNLYLSTEENQRAVVVLNVVSNRTVAGLYVITREYVNEISADDNDKKVLDYYFVVDRNGIIVASGEADEKSINGGYISFGLKNNEMQYSNFSTVGVPDGRISFIDHDSEITTPTTIEYNVYLTTNRLPAVLNIPVGKYFYSNDYQFKPTRANLVNGTSYFGSEYYSGRLLFDLYFNDTQRQLTDITTQAVLKLFAGEYNGEKGYLTLNLNQQNLANEIKSRLIGENGEFISLPGDYILVVKDNVEGVDNVVGLSHQKVLGFRIVSSLPSTDLYSAKEKEANFAAREDSANENNSYSLVTNKEFVILDMQNIESEIKNGTQISAELDLDYLKVLQTYNGVETTYIDYDHGYDSNKGGINIDDSSSGAQRIVDENDPNKTINRKIWLDTKLRDAANNIYDFETLSKPLSYTIEVRFNVVDENANYAGCYYYYDEAGGHQAFSRTYYVSIDRVPPQTNTINLLAQDGLARRFSSEMFENVVDTQNGEINFVRRYKDYYSGEKDASKIYALHVDETTPFSMNDVDKIYVRRLEGNLKDVVLSLPADWTNEGNSKRAADYYVDLGLDVMGAYYEIVEEDRAGNVCQYVIFYDQSPNANEKLNLTFNADVATNGIPQNATINLNFGNLTSQSYTIFSLSFNAINSPSDLFYIFELTKGGQAIATIKTNFITNFNKAFADSVIEYFTNAGFGNYNLTLTSILGSTNYTINYLDRDNTVSLLPENIIKQFDNTRYYFDLAGANETVDGITYYATRIVIEQGSTVLTFDCRVEDGAFNYYLNGEKVENNIVSEINGQAIAGSYRITLTDILDKTYHINFNTDGQQDKYITFGENGHAAHSEYNGVYYSFNQANISFDNVVYTTYTVRYTLSIKGRVQTGRLTKGGNPEGDLFDRFITIEDVDGRTNLVILPYFEDDNASGAVLDVVVNLTNSLNDDASYHVVVDTTSGAVALRNNALDGENKAMTVDINKLNETDLFETEYPEIYAGVFYLTWVPSQNNWFKLNYSIYEEMLDGTQQKTDLNGDTYYVISTEEGSTGIYRFVVEILNTNDVVLGNKVYTFAVQPSTTDYYSVRTRDNRPLTANSSFKFSEVDTIYNGQLNVNGVGLDLREITDEIPLYIHNEELVIHHAEDKAGRLAWQVFNVSENGRTYVFTIYRVYLLQSDVNYYFGTLIVKEEDALQANLVSDLQMLQDDDAIDITSPYLSTTTNKFYGSGNFVLTGKQNIGVVDASLLKIINKNSIVLSVWCNGEYLNDYLANNNGENFNFSILGSGIYTFVFKDLAGNQHNFNHNGELDGTSNQVEELNLVVLREIVLKVNGMQAIDNAYYNGQVVVDVFRPSVFYPETRVLDYSCTLNGESYQPSVNRYSYTFSHYGTYKIKFGIKLSEEFSLYKTLVFTIINEKEAMQSFDLTTLFSYKITQLKNTRGDTTNEKGESLVDNLTKLINSRQDKNKYLLTYEFLQENAESLGVTSGKQTLTFTYLVDDGIYPVREVEFSITLNNQMPNIECNVAPGETTKKSFTISFTPGLIYDRVGESEIYINDMLVYVIDENSANVNTPQSFTVSYKGYGAGDYYVVLRGKSGTIFTSFKVTIKEPLNTWSIIVIVVVVGIISAIVGTIIFLRKRMKIR